jgi:hypothetical protein
MQSAAGIGHAQGTQDFVESLAYAHRNLKRRCTKMNFTFTFAR